jgi:hypothetical protein
MSTPLRQTLEKLAALPEPAFLMGGIAEDLRLGDPVERPHKDLDLLAAPATLAALREQLEARQPQRWETVLAGQQGEPLLVRGQAGELELEIYAARAEPEGFSFEVPPQGPAGRLRLFMPADTFAYPPSLAEGLALYTVSPLALALMRASSAETRHTGDKSVRDWAMVARLKQAFGLDEQALRAPRLTTV